MVSIRSIPAYFRTWPAPAIPKTDVGTEASLMRRGMQLRHVCDFGLALLFPANILFV
jgi:hypothetical protein